jgi:hypothetical protein
MFFALPFARLPGNWGKAGQFCRLLTAQFSKLGHVGQDRTGCDFGYARCPAAHACMCERGNARQDVSLCAQIFIGSNDRQQ